MIEFLQGWTIDYKTAILTIIVSPVIFSLFRVIEKHLREWTLYALEGILFWASRRVKHRLAAYFSLREYCRLKLKDEALRHMHVPSSTEISLDIDTAFVPLSLEYSGGQEKLVTHQDILNKGNRVIIVGDPGSGKSSLVKILFRHTCRAALKAPQKAQLPIIIELKNLSISEDTENLGTWFLEKLKNELSRTSMYQMGECFDAYVKTSGLLVLLDGLDEVSSPSYTLVRDAINELGTLLVSYSENNKIILTTRTQFYRQISRDFANSFSLTFYLKPFAPNDIFEFLVRWPFSNKRDDQITRIYNDLTDRPTLREMCSNPLILAMYVAEDQASNSKLLPETRTEFYSKVSEELMVKRRFSQKGPAVARSSLREQRFRILGTLALDHLFNGDEPANSLGWDKAIQLVSETVKCSAIEAEELFREISKETGIFTEERSGETYRFIHLTFCEFLAANEAINGRIDGWEDLITAHRTFQSTPDARTRLVEVIPFASGLLSRVYKHKAISDLLDLKDSGLIARGFLETKYYEHEGWAKFQKREYDVLLGTPEKEWDHDWLRRLHLFNVVVQDAENSSAHIPSSPSLLNLEKFYTRLVSKQKRSLTKLLEAYAKQDATAAFRLAEICNFSLPRKAPSVIVANCDQPPFLALVRRYAVGTSKVNIEWITLIAEACLQFGVVRKICSGLESPPEWNALLAETPSSFRWYDNSLIEKNYFTSLLSIALYKGDFNGKDTPSLKTLAKIPAPGTWRFGFMSYGFFLMIGLGLLIGVISIIYPPINLYRLLIPSWAIGILAIIFLFSYYFVLRDIGLQNFYSPIIHPYRIAKSTAGKRQNLIKGTAARLFSRRLSNLFVSPAALEAREKIIKSSRLLSEESDAEIVTR